MTKITGTVHEDQYKFLTISRTILLRMTNSLDIICIETQKHFIFHNFFPENRAFHEIMWKKYYRAIRVTDDNVKCNAFWVPKATNTQSEYEILIVFLDDFLTVHHELTVY